LAAAGVITGQKVYQYSADPVGEKDCAPLAPESVSAGRIDPSFMRSGEPESMARPLTSVSAGRLAQLLPISMRTQARAPQWAQKGGTINDASCLNRTPVYGVVQITSTDDVRTAMLYAKANKLKVSIAGVRHSMGGQAFSKNAIVLDMRQLNQMSLDETTKILTVQSGATWHDIQGFLHPKYAVKAMQSTDIFTVGGSIAVNAHGMDHRAGAVGRTIRSMRVMLPDGSIEQVSRTENRELFDLVVGGYGLFGIILDVQLEITDNVVYTAGREIVDYRDFPRIFEDELSGDGDLGLFYGHLSTGPQSFLKEMIFYTYRQTDVADAEIPPLGEVSSTRLRRFVLNFSKRGSLPMRLKWFAEKHLEPKFESCSVNRNQAMKDGEACLVSRNEPMHDSVKYLKNTLKNDTDILQEYFIPRDQFIPFVDELRTIITSNQANLLNASVRVVHKEDTFLTYAPADMYSIVLYVNQKTTPEDNARMAKVTRELIDLTTRLNGRFFLPYQLHYSPEQLQQSYPQIGAFFEAKRRYDPEQTLSSTFYERYAPFVKSQ
jgi:FAD/FMN-containing dehydrogenase